MAYLAAFFVAGTLCALGQLIIDRTSLTQAHVMVIYVVAGAVLTGLGLYQQLIRIAGAGATVLVSNFGFVLTSGVAHGFRMAGFTGALSGVFAVSGAVIAATVFFSFIMALVFQPKG